MNKLKEILSSKGWLFLAVLLVFSMMPYYLIIQEGTTESGWTMLLMWMPALAAIVMRVWHKEGIFKGVNWNPLKNLKFLLLAAFLPFVIEVVATLIGVSIGSLEIKPEFLVVNEGLISVSGTALLFGASDQPWYVFVPNYLLSYFIGTLFYSLAFAFGEEYGWRGYLQKEWAGRNQLVGFLAIGIVWGLWHFPGVLLGHNYPDYPILGAFVLMPFLTAIFSVCFGLTFNKTRVIWIPVVFHGAVNISAEAANKAIIETSVHHAMTDLVWTGLWLLFGVIFWRMRHRFH